MTPHKPDYYSQGGIELSDIIRAYKLNWHTGSAVKYILRAGHKKKDSLLKDLIKARSCLDMEIEEVQQCEELRRKTNGHSRRAPDHPFYSTRREVECQKKIDGR